MAWQPIFNLFILLGRPFVLPVNGSWDMDERGPKFKHSVEIELLDPFWRSERDSWHLIILCQDNNKEKRCLLLLPIQQHQYRTHTKGEEKKRAKQSTVSHQSQIFPQQACSSTPSHPTTSA